MNDEISIMFNENGEAQIYDSTFDVTIHCENEEEQNKVLEILNRQWIPVSERLPEECGEIKLVTCKTKTGIYNVNRAYYSHESGSWHGSGSMAGVIAWMDLPEPYKEV